MLGLKKGTVKLEPHSHIWEKEFEKEKDILLSNLGERVVAIEHIGSTAIPNILAKPILDIDIGVGSLEAIEEVARRLASLGYREVKNMRDPDIHLVFAKGSKETGTTQYAHLMRHKGPIWQDDIVFRDYLRSNTRKAEEYEALKKKLATQYAEDRMAYTKGKKSFIDETVALAKKEG